MSATFPTGLNFSTKSFYLYLIFNIFIFISLIKYKQLFPAHTQFFFSFFFRAHTIDEQNFVRVKHVLLPNISGDMIGDFSRQFQLPTVPGKNGHLTYITPETVRSILNHISTSTLFCH